MTALGSATGLTYETLSPRVRQKSCIGAEIQLPKDMPILDVDLLHEDDKHTLRDALFRNQVVVIRNQGGIDPVMIPKLAKIFDSTAIDVHSAGAKAVSDPKNILSAYKAGRHPRVPQVSKLRQSILGDTFADFHARSALLGPARFETTKESET